MTYSPLDAPAELQWRESWDRTAASGPAALTLHCVRVPPARVAARDFVRLADRVKTALRSSGQVRDDVALTVAEDHDGIAVTVGASPRRYGEVSVGEVLGIRVAGIGQISVWRSLPADNMGAVLDPIALGQALAECLALVASTWELTEVDLAVAIELNSVTLITDGDMSILGKRSSATISGAMRRDLRVEPDESLHSTDLGHDCTAIATDLAPVVLRAWRLS